MLHLLGGAGYEVEMAENGIEAINKYRENPADLVVTDIIMPEKEGIETIIELKRDYPQVKIIALSGGGTHGPKDYLDSARLLGVEETFYKPFEMDDLLEKVNELLDS